MPPCSYEPTVRQQYGKHIRGVVFATWPRGLDSAVIIAELGVDT
jgi:hypothetical protein